MRRSFLWTGASAGLGGERSMADPKARHRGLLHAEPLRLVQDVWAVLDRYR
jgi:hypothetical protein